MLESQVHISPDTINRLMGAATLAAEPGLRPEKLSPLPYALVGVSFNLVFQNVYDQGCCYAENEHRAWLNESGFVDFRRHSLPDGTPLITALKGSSIPAVRSSDQEDYYVG